MERFNLPVLVFATICTKARRCVFTKPDSHALLIEAWTEATSWIVGRYVIMPDHIHLFCAPNEAVPRGVKQWIGYWKSIASRHWPRPAEHPLWLRDVWGVQIRTREHYAEKWAYVRQNPVRAGLVAEPTDWPYRGELNQLRW